MITTKTVNFRLVKGIQARLTGASAHAIRGDENYFCHRHSYYELHVVEKGSCVFSINDHAYRVGAGNFCLIVPETYHYLLSTSDDCRKLCLGVELTREHEDAAGEPSLLDALDESRVVIHASAAVCRWAEELFSLMRADRSDVISQELLRAQLALLLLNVLDEIVPRPGRQEKDEESFERSRGSAIDDYLNSHFYIHGGGAQLAKELGVCERQLHRIFLSLYGKGYQEKVREIRLEVSLNLLKSTKRSVEEIASLVGYENASSFICFVKKYTGLTPKAIRSGG